ncbi:MAG: DUF3299 domain-containing protein [Gammaproteobacteria bacterium]
MKNALLFLIACLALAATGAADAATPKKPASAPPAVGAPLPPPLQAPADEARVLELEWEELLPEDRRKDYNAGPPAATHDYLSGEGGLAAQQVMDFTVNPKLDGQMVKLPGFIVPLELDDAGKVTEFFLVPYFGACIHVPPPPANQMVYVTLKQGIQLDSMYAAFWVTGRMTAKGKSTRLGAAAYGIAATRLDEYKY